MTGNQGAIETGFNLFIDLAIRRAPMLEPLAEIVKESNGVLLNGK